MLSPFQRGGLRSAEALHSPLLGEAPQLAPTGGGATRLKSRLPSSGERGHGSAFDSLRGPGHLALFPLPDRELLEGRHGAGWGAYLSPKSLGAFFPSRKTLP